MNVKTIAAQFRERSAVPASYSADGLAEHSRFPDFLELAKPRVMVLAVFTAVVGLIIAHGELAPLQALAAVLSIAAGAGAAGALNMWYDADIDAVMSRTAMRPIPRGSVAKDEALVFGCILGAIAVAVLALATNLAAARAPGRHDPLLCGRVHGLAEAVHCCRAWNVLAVFVSRTRPRAFKRKRL